MKEYTEYCDNCEDQSELTLICKFVSGTGMTFYFYQCPSCKKVTSSMADDPLKIERGTCPRCGSENPKEQKSPGAVPQFICPDCGLIFRESSIADKPIKEPEQ